MSFATDAIHFTPRDARSPEWVHLEKDLLLRLQALREENDAGDEIETATRRGRIAEIKELLEIGRAHV